jgi:hypothetical protein
MNDPHEKGRKPDRREFLRRAARGLILGGLGFLTAKLLSRGRRAGAVYPPRRVSARRRLACVSRGVCPGCRLVSDCELPQAILARRSGRTSEQPPIHMDER